MELCLAPYESAVFVVSETELECTGEDVPEALLYSCAGAEKPGEACGQITERKQRKVRGAGAAGSVDCKICRQPVLSGLDR